MSGRFENIPLLPSVAREIIKALFVEQAVWKKSAIDARVERLHQCEGGLPGKQPVSMAVKKALQDLQAEGLVVNRFGHWQLCEVTEVIKDGLLEPDLLPEVSIAELDEDAGQEELDVTIEKEVGTGGESVYFFFNPNDRKLAILEGRTTWECKVGKTSASDTLARVFSLRTAMSHQPVIGLVIRTHDSSALEKALHAALRLIDAPVPDSPGAEWFMTSPICVESWFSLFQQSLAALTTPVVDPV